ncbi:MAG: hypothetical protein H7308_09010 [Chthonomonadaceae bacterium]|nr:hypothetical protein [Chthonomonadaceae bacterium]
MNWTRINAYSLFESLLDSLEVAGAEAGVRAGVVSVLAGVAAVFVGVSEAGLAGATDSDSVELGFGSAFSPFSGGRLSLMYQPVPLNTIPTG